MKVRYSKFQSAMEVLGLFLIIGLIGFVTVRWNQLPNQIPLHYNALGQPDSWASKGNIIIVPVITTLLYVMFSVISLYPQTWSVPVKANDENGPIVYRTTRSLLVMIKLEILAFFSYITYKMAMAQALAVSFLPVMLIVILGTVVFFTIRISRLSKKHL